MNFNTKFYNPGDRFFRNYRSGKSYWKNNIVTKRIGTVIYIIKGKRYARGVMVIIVGIGHSDTS